MTVAIQLEIKNNIDYRRYLKEHSYWYKDLNRDPANLALFINEVKDAYGLRTTAKLTKALETIEIMQNLMTSFK